MEGGCVCYLVVSAHKGGIVVTCPFQLFKNVLETRCSKTIQTYF